MFHKFQCQNKIRKLIEFFEVPIQGNNTQILLDSLFFSVDHRENSEDHIIPYVLSATKKFFLVSLTLTKQQGILGINLLKNKYGNEFRGNTHFASHRMTSAEMRCLKNQGK